MRSLISPRARISIPLSESPLLLPALSKAEGEILNTRPPRFILKTAFIVIPFDPSSIPRVYADLLSAIPRGRREGPSRRRAPEKKEGQAGESSGWKPTVAKAFTKALLFLCLRARTGGKARVEKPSVRGSKRRRRRWRGGGGCRRYASRICGSKYEDYLACSRGRCRCSTTRGQTYGGGVLIEG